MKALIVAGGSPATVFALAPLASALRLSGHDLLVAAPRAMVDYANQVGLPAISVTPFNMVDFMFTDKNGSKIALPTDPDARIIFNGRGFGRLAAASIPALKAIVKNWKPDILIGGALCYAAPIVAASERLPYVRHTWDLGEPPEMDIGAGSELAGELCQLGGLTSIPDPDFWIDICPPELRGTNLAPGLRHNQRFVPFNLQRALEPWMLTHSKTPRICITAGSRVSDADSINELLNLVNPLSDLDIEIIVAAPDAVKKEVEHFSNVKVGWLPLDVILPNCDVIVHHGGGQTTLNAIAAGIPQVIFPAIPKMIDPCLRLSSTGAAVTLLPEDQGPQSLVHSVSEILNTNSYRENAESLSQSIEKLPSPEESVQRIESLVENWS